MTISVGNLIVAGGATVDTSEVLSALNKQGLKVWVGTKTQRDALPENIKNDDKITFLTYDSEEDIYLIIDTIISYSKTWSSVKISTELAKKINSSDVYTKTEVMSLINSKVASALKYRGAVATVAALPSSGQENGDSYYVQADGYMYAWSSDYSDWQALGSATDMTNYYTKTEVDALLADMAVKFQYNVMPTADSTTVGKIIQYTGADTNDYKNGYWYKGVDNGDSTYSWSLYTDDKYALSAYSNDLQLTYEGSSYATTSALITQLTTDIVARKHSAGTIGGNIAITWTGKSCVTGSYSIHSSGAGFVVLDFENAQDGNKHCVYYISNGSATGITWSNLATGFATQSSTDMFADLNLEAGQTYHLYDIWSKIYAKYGECNFVGSVKWVGANSFNITDGTNTIQVTNGTFVFNCPIFTQFWISMTGSFTLGTKTALKSYSVVCTKDTSSFQEEISQLATENDLPTSGVGTGINKQDIVSGDANTTINIPAYHFCSGLMYLQISGIGTALLSYDTDFDRNLTLKVIAGTGILLTSLTLYKGQASLGTFSMSGDYITFAAQYYTVIRTNYASL